MFAPWTAATHCTGGATPGAQIFMKWALARFPHAHNLGIYSCRNVVGGSSYSCHAEGRADDIGWPEKGGRGGPEGHAFVQLLRPVASLMGIQCIIYDRTIWSAKSPGVAGRPYTGTAAHFDHTHIEFTRSAGVHLNLATILAAVPAAGAPKVPAPPTAAPSAAVPVNLTAVIAKAKSTGLYDGRVALALIAEGLSANVKGYAAWQRSVPGGNFSGHDADGIAGRASLTALGKRHGFSVA